PEVTTTEPPACRASLPDSNVMSWDPMGRVSLVATGLPPCWWTTAAHARGEVGSSRGGEPWPVVSGESPGRPGGSQLITDRSRSPTSMVGGDLRASLLCGSGRAAPYLL